MKTVTLVSQKGGSGKSTLAINLAVAATRAKKRVLLLDLDPQQTSEAWYQDREAKQPALVAATAKQLPEALKRARSAKIDFVFIDTPGRDEPAAATAIKHADFCLVPCRPTSADMKAIPPTVATLKRLACPFAFVLTQTPPRGSRIHEGLSGLGKLHPSIASPPIVSRVAYQDAQGVGQGVVEFDRWRDEDGNDVEGKASIEIKQLWKWLNLRIKRLSNG